MRCERRQVNADVAPSNEVHPRAVHPLSLLPLLSGVDMVQQLLPIRVSERGRGGETERIDTMACESKALSSCAAASL